MLSLAQVTKNDVVYDLGSGDGRIVIAAAKKYGARAVGIEIDTERVKEARRNARRAGVGRLVTFRLEDAMTANMADATVVTLYLLSSGNDLLKPALLRLKPGTRVVSHAFGMAGWQPEKVDRFTDAMGDERVLYLWRVPAVQ
jgi:precorrin-6B methylase 2